MTQHCHPDSVESCGVVFLRDGQPEELKSLECSTQRYTWGGIVLTRFSIFHGLVHWRANLSFTIRKGMCTPMGVGAEPADALENLQAMVQQERVLLMQAVERATQENIEFLQAASELLELEECQ